MRASSQPNRACGQGGRTRPLGYITCVDDEIDDAQAADDEAWLASLSPGRRVLVEMVLVRLCEAERDSTYRPQA